MPTYNLVGSLASQTGLLYHLYNTPNLH